ncbi:MAG: hypothetical protein K6E97_04735 [Treponema sp.]|nr:hypothetical protein [Treponema sp.]
MKKLISFVFFMALICSSVVCKPAEGNAVTGLKGALTVTPGADGLYLKFDCSKVPQWKRVRIWVRDIEEWQTNYFMKFDSNVSECVYPFVEKDKKYQIWVTAYGENWNWITETWTDWENPDREWFEVTATGGVGNCRANCSDAAYYNHEIYLTYLSEIYPAVFKSKKITGRSGKIS